MLAMTELSFGARLSAAREAKGITKYRLAKETGLSQAYVGQLEAGSYKPSDEVISKIAHVLGVSVEQLTAWADEDRLGPDRVFALEMERLARTPFEYPKDLEALKAAVKIIMQMIKDLPEDASDEVKAAHRYMAVQLYEKIRAIYDAAGAEIERRKKAEGK